MSENANSIMEAKIKELHDIKNSIVHYPTDKQLQERFQNIA